MPWVANVAKSRINSGWHPFWPSNTVLISINDPAGTLPNPKHDFMSKYYFSFLDYEEENDEFSEFVITGKQAQSIVEILEECYEQGNHVVIHCSAGICRSGAVTRIAQMIGFEEVRGNNSTSPNLLVLRKLKNALFGV